MEIVACPTTSQIVQLLFGRITGPYADQLSKHLETCDRCFESMQKLDNLSSEAIEGGTKPVSALPADAQSKALLASRIQHGKLAFLDPPQKPDEIGRLAHYRVLRILGEGGMGMVLKAEDTNLERLVALKVIKSEYQDDDDVRQRFMREARAMAKVKNDHVVTVHQVGEHNGVCFIAMELLEGGPLDHVIEKPSRPSLAEILRIGREVAQALVAAHSRGLLHRDIKPENVWLEAPNGRVKLLDFGLARPQQMNMKLTASGMVMGTPAYMSPEQARAGDVDGRTDLFSLGCLLYALISGDSPFSRGTLMDTLLALANETPAPPSECNHQCPRALDDLILCLLAKDPKDRLASAEQVIEHLQAIESDLAAHKLGGAVDTPVRVPSSLPSARTVTGSLPPFSKATASSRAIPSNASIIRKSERRQVTVLACGCHLFESEEYLEHIDAEDQERILKSFEQSCRDAVAHSNGTIVQCNEENLIAVFGYPVAQEDAAQMAATTALGALDALSSLAEKLQNDHKLELKPWITIHTGPAIVAAEEGTVSLVGEARNVAVRLKDNAATGQIILSESTHNLLRGKFDCTTLGQHKVKGLEKPTELFRLLVPLEAADEVSTSGQIELTPLTGRDLEISLLKDRWEQAQDGMGQVVLLVGEAGLGKSRLVHAMKEHALQSVASASGDKRPLDNPVVEWRCSPHFTNTGLYPACNFFQRVLQFRRSEPASAQFDRLVKHLDQFGMATKEVVPLFASLLSLPADNRFPTLGLTPSREREATFQALRDWLHAYSARQPVLFVIEDLHWLDASTLEFLGQLLAEGLHDRMLILLTFRPEFLTPWPALAHQTSLALNRLTKRQVGELMHKKLDSEVSESVVNEVYDRSGGVPLFVEEFTKMLKESDMLVKKEQAGKTIKSMMARVIPATLQDLIMARLDRMEGDRELAQFCSTLGREFSYEFLASVVIYDDDTLQAELAKLVQAEILFQKGRPPNSTYVFKHALLEDALYNAMIKSHRQQCHARISDTLESHFVTIAQAQPELLAHHLTEAGLVQRSIPYWLAAGLRSQEQFANVEAIGHFTRGLDLLATLPESQLRDKHELSLLSPLGSSYQMTMGYAAPEVAPTFERARALCEKLGDNTQLFEVMWGNWTWHLVRADLDLCMTISEEMMALARASNDKGTIMEAYVAPAVTLFYRGDFEGCRSHCEKAISEYEDLQQCLNWSAKLGQNSAVVLRCYLCLALWHLGLPDMSLKKCDEMLALARKIAHPFSLNHAQYFACWLYQYCRMGSELAKTALEEATLAADQGFALWQSTGEFHKGAARLLQGDVGGGIEQMESGVHSFKAIAAALTLPAQLAVLAEGYITAARLQDAEEALNEGLAQAERMYDRVYLAELCRLKGTLILSGGGDQAVAESFFREAIDHARQQKSKGWELRTAISLAMLCRQQGRVAEARSLLEEVYGSFAERATTSDAREAQAILGTLR